MLCLYVFEVLNAAVLEKWGQRLQNPGDLLNREIRALFVRVKCSALLGEIVLNRLLDSLEGIRVEASTGAGEKLNGPLIDEFFGREFFAHAQFCERSVELEGRYGRVRMTNKKACIDRATAAENQSRRHAFGVFGARRGVSALGSVPNVDVAHVHNCSANSLQLEQVTNKHIVINQL